MNNEPKEDVENSITYDKQRRIFKIIVIGDSNVGKTCLTFRFCGRKFPSKTEATIGVDFRERMVEVEGEQIKLQLWDTAGQERFRKSMVQHYYRNVHAVVIVYDVTKVASFESLPHWMDECNKHQLNTTIPRILVGNKFDCKETVAVSTNIAQRFADYHNMPLFETSAKDESEADNVEAIFLTLAHKLKNSKPMMPVPLGASGAYTFAGYRSDSRVVLGPDAGSSATSIPRQAKYLDETSTWCC